MEIYMRENGVKIKCMGKEDSPQKMEYFYLENLEIINLLVL